MYSNNFPGTAPGTTTTQASSLGVQLTVQGLLGVPGPSAQPAAPNGFISGAVAGTGTVDMNLDNTNSGTLFITGSSFTLANVAFSQSGTILGFFPYSIQLNLNNVQFAITAGPVAVTNGTFVINSSTVGSLSLNNGTLSGLLNVPTFGVNNQAFSIDLSTSPVNLDFASLGTSVIQGFADDDNGGTDNGVPDGSGHTANVAGLTGVNTLDTDGAEVRISLNGITINTSLAVNSTTTLPAVIGLSGTVAISVPEAGSMTLVGLAGVAGLALVRRRRSA
jgi:MYXO-CTERM domain-containing protein